MSAMAAVMIAFAYLLGSIPTGYIMGLMAGVDVRASGSGNVGATNVARVLGKREGLLTLLADAAKGFIPVFVAFRLGFTFEALAAVAVAAFLGHVFPVFLRFRGGKGVATALGVFLGLAPLATAVLMVVFVVVVFFSRIVSLSSITAAAMAPLVFWLASYPPVWVATSFVLAAIIILRHRANIQRLIAGTEPKFDA
jgi:acyl phosphate:glycerol-3-phosphate acyltransferase